jgi:uncharacterized protein YkuJ
MNEALRKYIEEGVELVNSGSTKKDAARQLIKTHGDQITITLDSLRNEIARHCNSSLGTALKEECEENGIELEDVKHFWHKSKKFSLFVKKEDEATSFEDIRSAFVNELKQFAPVYPVLKRPQYQHPHLLIVDAADIHFGKYSTISETGEETTTATTRKRFNDGIDGIIEKVQGYKFDKIIYVGGNDILHTDNAIGTTTSGTRQDTSGLWHENYLVAKQATIEAIDKLLVIADVHYVHCPSNHDFMAGFFLADAISSHYYNNQNITFDITPFHRKYIQYGTSLMGFSHADGAKDADLNDLLKTECKAAWSKSKHAYWYLHHIHHKDKKAIKGTQKIKMEKDYRGVTVLHTGLALEAEDYCFVEYVRSLSGTDRWHATNGFIHAPKAIEAFVHCPLFGQIARFSHLF